MDKQTAYFLARAIQLAPWVIGLVGLIGILWRLGRIATLLEQIRDSRTTEDKTERVRIPGLND